MGCIDADISVIQSNINNINNVNNVNSNNDTLPDNFSNLDSGGGIRTCVCMDDNKTFKRRRHPARVQTPGAVHIENVELAPLVPSVPLREGLDQAGTGGDNKGQGETGKEGGTENRHRWESWNGSQFQSSSKSRNHMTSSWLPSSTSDSFNCL